MGRVKDGRSVLSQVLAPNSCIPVVCVKLVACESVSHLLCRNLFHSGIHVGLSLVQIIAVCAGTGRGIASKLVALPVREVYVKRSGEDGVPDFSTFFSKAQDGCTARSGFAGDVPRIETSYDLSGRRSGYTRDAAVETRAARGYDIHLGVAVEDCTAVQRIHQRCHVAEVGRDRAFYNQILDRPAQAAEEAPCVTARNLVIRNRMELTVESARV